MTDATSPYLNRPLRSLDQVTGANVIKGPWPCETPGTPTPRVLVEGITMKEFMSAAYPPPPSEIPLQTLWELYLDELLQFIWELKK